MNMRPHLFFKFAVASDCDSNTDCSGDTPICANPGTAGQCGMYSYELTLCNSSDVIIQDVFHLQSSTSK